MFVYKDIKTTEFKKHSVILVKKCLNSGFCEPYDNFFEIKRHKKSTRNNGFLLQVP